MNPWFVDIPCFWSDGKGRQKFRFRMQAPKPKRGGLYAESIVDLGTLMGGELKILGADSAQVKRITVNLMNRLLVERSAALVDRHGSPIDLRLRVPIDITDYAGIERDQPEGRRATTIWRIRRQCIWADGKKRIAFTLKVSPPLPLGAGKIGHRIATDCAYLGNLKILDASGYVIGHAFSDFAEWRRADILNANGKPIDFSAVAELAAKPRRMSNAGQYCRI